MVLEAGAPINHADAHKRSALYHASKEGHVEMLLFLLKAGADLSIVQVAGRDALMVAARMGRLGCLKVLSALDPNRCAYVSFDGRTPLMLAAGSSMYECVRHLLTIPSVRATINQADRHGLTALCHALSGAECTEDMVRLLVDAGAEIDYKTHSLGQPLFSFCFVYQAASLLRLLISLSPRPLNLDAWVRETRTGLMIACERGDVENVQVLLAHGANPRLQSIQKNRTALHLAVLGHHVQVVKAMMAHVRNPRELNIADADGLTPMKMAIRNVNAELCRALLPSLDLEAKTDIEDVLQFSQTHGSPEVVSLLKRKLTSKLGANCPTQ
eukprot:TRINITY_DN11488_c0_g2_i1.p1 TRINITY_DN11488_c0_g2~~TRINITY_DN11488_c0_g2_i1.p1  ORF type:complete len:327 (-),score=13.26 TRINITY_DN11488_c0_g2_i1:17-997(-)